MRHASFLTVAVAISLSPFAASAVPVQGWGVHAGASTAGNCPSFCSGSQFAFDSDTSQGPFATSSESTYASGSAEVSMTSGQYLPTLRARGEAGVGKRGAGTAFGVQGFEYTGTATQDVELELELTGTVTEGSGGYTSAGIGSSVAFIRGDSLDFFADFGTLVYEVADNRLVTNLSLGAGDTLDTGSLTFTLDPGDEFYIVGSMTASANNGLADSFSTLTMAMVDPTSGTPISDFLSSSSGPVMVSGSKGGSGSTGGGAGGGMGGGMMPTTPIPVPTGLLLLGTALAGLGGLRRRG